MKIGSEIKTKSGYYGKYIDKSIDGKTFRVLLDNSTYSDDDWYDEIPSCDIIFIEKIHID